MKIEFVYIYFVKNLNETFLKIRCENNFFINKAIVI